jgi:hypothetical protein
MEAGKEMIGRKLEVNSKEVEHTCKQINITLQIAGQIPSYRMVNYTSFNCLYNVNNTALHPFLHCEMVLWTIERLTHLPSRDQQMESRPQCPLL